jgi:nitroreductase
MDKVDKYQKRYTAHQMRKSAVLKKLIKDRHSTRVFSEKEVPQDLVKQLIDSIVDCPSSCDRQPISIKVVDDRDDKSFLNGVLVGGVGWIHRANKILLIFANSSAYKERQVFMPFLDAGVVVYHLYLMAQMMGLKCCFVNPNIRERHQPVFRVFFGSDIFCGAFAIGYEEK